MPSPKIDITFKNTSGILCQYGCNTEAKFRFISAAYKEKFCCSRNSNSCIAVRELNKRGVIKAHKEGRLPGWRNLHKTHDLAYKQRGKFSADFSLNGKGNHKMVLIQERGHACECCKNSQWMGRDIVIEMHHVDGDRFNNIKENLVLLCPNCHSQTPNWKGRGINVVKRNYSSFLEKHPNIVEVIQTSCSIKEVIDKLKEGVGERTYKHIRDVIREKGISLLHRSPKEVSSKNSQFGKIWITNGIINQKLKKEEEIPEGFCRGRVITRR